MAWANSCQTTFAEIKALNGKKVVAEYVERENKNHPLAPYTYVIKLWQGEAQEKDRRLKWPQNPYTQYPSFEYVFEDWLEDDARKEACCEDLKHRGFEEGRKKVSRAIAQWLEHNLVISPGNVIIQIPIEEWRQFKESL
jgi:hypothetical protein